MENSTENLKRSRSKRITQILVAIGCVLFLLAFVDILPRILTHTYDVNAPQDSQEETQETGNSSDEDPEEQEEEDRISATHVETPEAVRGLYMTSWIAGTPHLRENIVRLVEETEVNTLVIDIKDDTGRVSFVVEDEELNDIGSPEPRIADVREFIEELHDKDIYVVGRIAVFQDPYLVSVRPDLAVKTTNGAVWEDRKGLTWLDPAAREVWEYVVRIAKASHDVGFDEIQFDYIRFPSDGLISDTSYPFSGGREKADVMEDFFAFINTEMNKADIPVSADIFGIATSDPHDNNIGQVYERVLPYFDYVSPMIYPSHYADGAFGYANPAAYPYEVVYRAMQDAVVRSRATTTHNGAIGWKRVGTSTPPRYEKPIFEADQLRPWIQDFDLGADYTASMVRAEIQALYDLGIDSWLIWDASNTYTVGALQPE